MKTPILLFLTFSFCFLLCFEKLHSQDLFVVKSETIDKSETPEVEKKSVVKYGIASFYAQKFNGRKTSTGAIYNSKILTAACNVLPLGTWVKVTNLRNKKTVIVEINDHLHYKNKRLIDLSKAAAHKLGFISRGITRVKLEVLEDQL